MGNLKSARRGKLNSAGFSFLELLMVVAIIVILGAIAIPNLLNARISANESAAVAAMQTLATEEVNYYSTYGSQFSPTLAAMGPTAPGATPSATNADMIDQILASGIRGGYQFIYVPVVNNGMIAGYQVNGNPISPGITGDWYFYLDQSNVIRRNYNSAASASSPPIPN
jgi:prepilin-type N-terminal cleavage/methylation domain-containing protein